MKLADSYDDDGGGGGGDHDHDDGDGDDDDGGGGDNDDSDMIKHAHHSLHLLQGLRNLLSTVTEILQHGHGPWRLAEVTFLPWHLGQQAWLLGLVTLRSTLLA